MVDHREIKACLEFAKLYGRLDDGLGPGLALDGE
jgi:hypothetical protein